MFSLSVMLEWTNRISHRLLTDLNRNSAQEMDWVQDMYGDLQPSLGKRSDAIIGTMYHNLISKISIQ